MKWDGVSELLSCSPAHITEINIKPKMLPSPRQNSISTITSDFWSMIISGFKILVGFCGFENHPWFNHHDDYRISWFSPIFMIKVQNFPPKSQAWLKPRLESKRSMRCLRCDAGSDVSRGASFWSTFRPIGGSASSSDVSLNECTVQAPKSFCGPTQEDASNASRISQASG